MKRVIAACLMVGAMLFCMCGVAHAEEPYTCEGGGNPVPATVSGNVIIGESGNCVINHNVTVTGGSISIRATGSIEVEGLATSGPYVVFLEGTNIKTDEIDSGGGFGVTAEGNVEVAGEVSTNIYGEGGNVLIRAEGEVATGAITTNGAAHSGAVEIQADLSGGNHLFTIGGSGNTNGVNGSITTNGTTTGGSNPVEVEGAYVTVINGTTASTGGITLESMADIDVVNSASRSGAITLDAQNGVLTLPSGHMSVDGSSGEMAGFIELMAKEVAAPDGAEITANQETSATASCHPINIAASKVTYGGTGLEIQANGNGYETKCGGDVDFVPQGGLVPVFYINEVSYIHEDASWTKTANTLSVTGTGPLTITANGSKDGVEFWGSELKIGSTDGSTTKILSYGSGDWILILAEEFEGTALSKLEFLSPVEGYATAETTGATPGTVTVRAKEIAKPSYPVALVADGIEGADGGTVEVTTSEGEVYLGSTSGTMELNASAYEGTGNAGTVKVKAGTGKVKVVEGNAVYASSFEGNSNGGLIEVSGGSIENVGGSNTGFYATGSGSGKGGTITLKSEGKLSIGGGSTEFFLSTVYESTGGGGTVNLSGSEVNINGGYIYVSAYPSGNGGNINVTSTGNLNVSNEYELTANAASEGAGGNISLTAKTIEFAEVVNVTANGAGEGQGGKISLNATESSSPLKVSGDEADAVEVTANGGSSGGKGGIVELTDNTNGVEIEGSAVAVNAGTNAEGGRIIVKGTEITVNGSLEANGNGSGVGGLIELKGHSTSSLELSKAHLLANSGSTGGDGGQISISNSSGNLSLSEEASVEANAISTAGEGGIITMNAGTAATSNGSISLTEESGVVANGGSTSGVSGKILLTYTGSSGQNISVNHSAVVADQAVAGGVPGSITFSNNEKLSTLNVVVSSNGGLSARHGSLFFNQKNGAVSIEGTSSDTELFVGEVEARGTTVALTDNSNESLTLGTITASTAAFLSLNGTGDMTSLLGTIIESPRIVLQSQGGTIGSSEALRTETPKIETTNSSSPQSVDISNSVSPSTILEVATEWTVTSNFEVETSGPMFVSGSIIQSAGNNGSLRIVSESGQLVVAEKVKVIALQGSILLYEEAVGGKISVGKKAEIGAYANGQSSLTLGDVLMSVGTGAVSNCTAIPPNVDIFPPTAGILCGVAGFSADPAPAEEIKIGVNERILSIYGPSTEAVVLHEAAVISVSK